jgi:hypothetical protein
MTHLKNGYGNARLINLFYTLKPLIPRSVQIYIRRRRAQKIYMSTRESWPINTKAGNQPENWTGWPGGKRFALILIHDVDNDRGHQRCRQLMKKEQELGFLSSFFFVPEKYSVDRSLREELTKNGFEVGVHGLKHDGRLFLNKQTFERRCQRINQYLQDWGVEGFSSPSMHHRLDWMHLLNIHYGISTFDVDPFEPQPDGTDSIFPFLFKNEVSPKTHLELPHTMPQDFTLFVILEQRNINMWKMKLNWIAQMGGMALLNTHPDYMDFSDGKPGIGEYPVALYVEFLKFIKNSYHDQCWYTLPGEMADFWRNNREIRNGGS